MDVSRVVRFEVIDHTSGSAQITCSPGLGRCMTAYKIRAALSLQDDGETLKVFLTSPPQDIEEEVKVKTETNE